MTKVAILATVWLHLVVLGLLVGGTEMLRIERLPVPEIQMARAPAVDAGGRAVCPGGVAP